MVMNFLESWNCGFLQRKRWGTSGLLVPARAPFITRSYAAAVAPSDAAPLSRFRAISQNFPTISKP